MNNVLLSQRELFIWSIAAFLEFSYFVYIRISKSLIFFLFYLDFFIRQYPTEVDLNIHLSFEEKL